MNDDAEIIKQPDLTYEIHPLLLKRWSPRAYSDTPVEKEKLQRIVEAARWSPSGSNHQPWIFLFGFKGDNVYHAAFTTLVEFNQLWVKTAPVIGLAIGIETNPKGELNKSFQYDLGQAVAMITIQASAEGLYVHQIGGFNHEALADQLKIPAGFHVMTLFTLGYRGNPEELHPNLKKLELTPRSRKPLDEFVFEGGFGQKASFL
jgi:nitroreductase